MLLAKIAKLDSHTVRGLLVALFGGLSTLAIVVFHISQTKYEAFAQIFIDTTCSLITVVGGFYALWARISLPNPPLSDTAVKKIDEAVASGKLQTRPTVPLATPQPEKPQ